MAQALRKLLSRKYPCDTLLKVVLCLRSSLPATSKRLGNYSEAKRKLQLERFENTLWNRWRHTCSVILNT